MGHQPGARQALTTSCWRRIAASAGALAARNTRLSPTSGTARSALRLAFARHSHPRGEERGKHYRYLRLGGRRATRPFSLNSMGAQRAPFAFWRVLGNRTRSPFSVTAGSLLLASGTRCWR